MNKPFAGQQSPVEPPDSEGRKGDGGPDKGAPKSLKHLYNKYFAELRRYIAATFGAGPPEPEDVAQTAFTRFAELEHPDQIENPRAFLYRIAHNLVISHHRQVRRHANYLRAAVGSEEEEFLDDFGPERLLIAEERYDLLKQAFRELPPLQQELLAMHRLQGLSYAEIARRKGMSQTEVKRQVARAVLACHQAVENACLKRIQSGAEQP